MQFIDLKRQYSKLKEEIDSAIHNVLGHGQYIMGPEVFSLEEKLSNFVGCKHTISCSSGTDALFMALMALDVKPGDRIITTPFTFIATAEVMSLIGAIPEFVDIDSKTFNISVERIEEKIKNSSDRYKVIMPVNIFGLPADYTYLNKLAEKYDFKIIEDAAQSFGASINEDMSCNLGDIGCTSFFPAKPLGCYGDGGAVFLNNNELAKVLESIRIHGYGQNKYDNVRVGINGRLDTMQAAILIPKLKVLSTEIKLRNKVAEQYNLNLGDYFSTQHIPADYTSSWAQYSILCDSSSQRKSIVEKLKNKNIPTAIYYIIPLHLQTVYNHLNYKRGDFPVSEEISSRILSLPMHPYLHSEEIEQICDAILGD